MNAGLWFTLSALDGFLFGIGLLAAPNLLAAAFGGQFDAFGVTVARVLGALLVAYGVFNWGLRGATGAPNATGGVYANILYHLLASVILGVATATNAMSPLAWGAAALHVVLLVGFATLLRAEPARNTALASQTG